MQPEINLNTRLTELQAFDESDARVEPKIHRTSAGLLIAYGDLQYAEATYREDGEETYLMVFRDGGHVLATFPIDSLNLRHKAAGVKTVVIADGLVMIANNVTLRKDAPGAVAADR